MANSVFGSSIQGFVVVFGFIILGVAIAYAALRNRQTPREEQRTEDATRALYEEKQPGQDESPR